MLSETIFECRCCGKSTYGMNDGSFKQPGWNRIEGGDGPNAVCPGCSVLETCFEDYVGTDAVLLEGMYMVKGIVYNGDTK